MNHKTNSKQGNWTGANIGLDVDGPITREPGGTYNRQFTVLIVMTTNDNRSLSLQLSKVIFNVVRVKKINN